MTARAGVAAVTAMSTGRMRLHPQHLERGRTPELWWLATSRRWTGDLPVNAFAVQHEQGLVLFDTGQDRASVLDPDGYYPRGPVGRLHRRVARFDIGERETLPALLEDRGLALGDVAAVVLSHLHQDHVGGLRAVASRAPHAVVHAARAELDVLGSRRPELAGVLPRHVDLPGLRWQPLDLPAAPVDLLAGAHDLFGDGAVLLLATPGHTPGSLSMLVHRGAGAPLLLVGDATFSDELLRRGALPGIGRPAVMRATSRALLALADRLGAVVLPAHDPGAARRLAASATADG